MSKEWAIYSDYLPDGEPEEVQEEEPFHQLLGQVSRLTNDS
jgi:hypothetical protein